MSSEPFGTELGMIRGTADERRTALEALISENAALPTERREGTSMLIVCAERGDAVLVDALLEAGANPNAIDAAGFSAIHKVIESCDQSDSNVRIVESLIAHGADLELVGINGWRPLHQAVTYGLARFAEILIGRGARVNARSEAIDRENALEIAHRLGHQRLTELLRNCGARRPLRRQS